MPYANRVFQLVDGLLADADEDFACRFAPRNPIVNDIVCRFAPAPPPGGPWLPAITCSGPPTAGGCPTIHVAASSYEIRIENLAELGKLHHGRKAGQPRSAEIRRFYEQARDQLQHPLLTFSHDDIAIIGSSFAQVIHDRGYTCYACAIMPDHVHLLIRRHRDKAEEMIEVLQKTSRKRLIELGRRAPTHSVWGGPGWKVFLNTRTGYGTSRALHSRQPGEGGMRRTAVGFCEAL